MNAQTQNQDKQTDYGFILDQPDVDAQRKKMRKKIKIISIVAGLLIIVLIASAIFSASRNVQPTQQTGGVIQNADSRVAAAEKVVRTFFTKANNKEYDKAYDLFDEVQAQISRSDFKKSAAKILAIIKLDECSISSREVSTQLGDEIRPLAICYLKGDKEVRIDFEFEMTESNNPKIINYRVVESE